MDNQKSKNSSEYMHKKVFGLLEHLTTELLFEKPVDVVGFMDSWLREKGYAVYERQLRIQKDRPLGVESSESEGDDFETEADHLETLPVVESRKTRMAISAEVVKPSELSEFRPKFVSKDQITKNLLKSLIHDIFLFNHLEGNELETLVDVIDIKYVGEGELVISQGDPGDSLYIVKTGKLKCTQINDKGENGVVCFYEPGQYFGELALLYNVPRATTISAVSQSTIFTLDRASFNIIVLSSIRKARERYISFLSSVEIFKTLSLVELERLCDAMKIVNFKVGQVVIEKGVRGDTFFIVLEGHAHAFDRDPESGELIPAANYGESSYFGELALIREQPRALNVIAQVK